MGEMDAGLYRLFESRFEERLDAPFIEVPAGKTYTYREAAGFAGAYSAVLHDFGVRKDNRSYGGWPDACANWMKEHGFLEPARTRPSTHSRLPLCRTSS